MKISHALGIIVLVFTGGFLLWLITGGPARYLSTMGPQLQPPGPAGETAQGFYVGFPYFTLGGAGSGISLRAGSSQGTPRTETNYARTEAKTLRDIRSTKAELWRAQDEEAKLNPDGSDFGTPSPYRSSISLSRGKATASAAKDEYVIIENKGKESVVVTGFTVVSERRDRSGYRRSAVVGNAAPTVSMERSAPTQGVVLKPGGKLYLVSGYSPYFESFQTTRCSGYLKNAVPQVPSACPSGREELEYFINKDNITSDCRSYLYGVGTSCTVPSTIPKKLESECKQLVLSLLTYDQCVLHHKTEPGFYLNEFRVYANSINELWQNDNDVLRLIDREGKTIDVISY